MRIVLVGNPNVGKSTIFLQLTGVNVTISNYPGTTVDFTRRSLTHGDRRVEVIDAPGTYGLEGHSEAERVAVELLEKGDIILNVVDATNLERNLNLTLQLLALGKPMVVAINMWDETKHKGIEIDAEKLSALLGIPVVTTSGRTGEGLAGEAVSELIALGLQHVYTPFILRLHGALAGLPCITAKLVASTYE